MYQIIANEIINRKKVKFSIVLNGEWKGKQIVSDGKDNRCLADDGIPDNLLKEVEKQNSTGILQMPDKTEVFTEIFTAEPELVILGGGHVAVPVCKLAAMTGFRVTVVEDRPDMVTGERFPDAANVVCQSFDDLSPVLDLQGDNSFYVIVTRGHQCDQTCLEQVLRREYAYVGVIGSRRKVANCQEMLRKHGFRNADIAAVHMPIGLNISAQTPEEIAVSILGEIIQEKNRKQTDTSPLAIWEWITSHPGEQAVVATIVAKTGSAPRGVGSRMLCLPDGKTVGTIGGGILEYAVIQAAKEMKKHEMQVREFNLSNEKGAELGMVCGGKVRVLMQNVEL